MIKGAPNRKERSTVSELADRLQLAQHTVTELVSRAEQAGLVRRDQSGTDRRVTYVRLTPQGERKLTGSFNDLGPDRHSLQSLIAPKPR